MVEDNGGNNAGEYHQNGLGLVHKCREGEAVVPRDSIQRAENGRIDHKSDFAMV